MKKIIFIFIFIIFCFPVYSEVLTGGIIHEDGKTITPFYFNGKINSFGIQYDNDLYHNFYYDTQGKLIQYDVLDRARNEFPHTTTSYDSNKNIISISKSISKTEQFTFTPDGKLKAHWIGNECYDAYGNKLSSSRILN